MDMLLIVLLILEIWIFMEAYSVSLYVHYVFKRKTD